MTRSQSVWRAGAAALCIAFAAPAEGAAMRLHFASNGNFGADGAYMPGQAGFNLADVSSTKELAALPAHTKGLVWVGRCGGADARFVGLLRAFIGTRNLFGFYLFDDPHPGGPFGDCPPDNLRSEADWIHANLPTVKTFLVLMNAGSSKIPAFDRSYRPEISHIDLFGFSPYPCRSELRGCDFGMIGRFVAAADAIGIPRDSMVPVYQAFGGGEWRDDGGGRYLLPTAAEEREILTRWRERVPAALFDYAYSWGSQRGDTALRGAAELQALFATYNNAR